MQTVEEEFAVGLCELVFSTWVRLSIAGVSCAFLLLVCVSPVLGTESVLVWQGSVDSSGDEVVGPVLADGRPYVIVAKNTWWYKYLPYNLAADAMYYTTDASNSIFWGNHFPAPGGHSFLQVDEHDVDWGPFSNGETGHTYTIGWNGSGTAVSFRIVDWMDNDYTNNVCHVDMYVYAEITVGGRVADWERQVFMYFCATGLIFGSAMILAFEKRARG